MKKFTALACLALSGGVLAFDQYLPVAKDHLEVDGDFSRQYVTGSYNQDGVGTSQVEGSFLDSYSPAVQFKYSAVVGLDFELLLHYDFVRPSRWSYRGNGSSGGLYRSGFGRPELAVKYVGPESGFGAFLNIALPMGDADLPGSPPLTLMPGAIFGNAWSGGQFNAVADYQFNSEVEGAKQDALQIYLQMRFGPAQFSPQLGLDYARLFQQTQDGRPVDGTSGYQFVVHPGWNMRLNDRLGLEIDFPLTMFGRNADAGWGYNVGVHWTTEL